MEIIQKALEKGEKTLSEYDSKRLLSSYGFPVVREKLVSSRAAAIKAAKEIGLPVVLKGCSPAIAHKTEKKLIEVDLRTLKEVERAYEAIRERVGDASLDGILVQEMVKGSRELVIGMIRDAQFGPCVMFGLGGIFTEVLKDVSFRIAPLEKRDALEMAQEIKGAPVLGAFRGMDPVDMDLLVSLLINAGKLGLDLDAVKEVDVNPLIISGNKPIAVDALVVLEDRGKS
ncbi:MAG: carboxylate--amine ligase [Deltaproteobacteria bacterium RBG_19FT_COMBO_52_11]|nr:MAG: carboxylate--amine ligase [Deltaproteobacteria bacterium RBG_19FT_COMBO_52_11]